MDYTLRYLPIAKQDLADAINFILNEYKNPIAAENTLDKIEQAIIQRLEDGPESFAIWQSAKKREHPYRRINVGNYTVWYIVIDNVMEIRRTSLQDVTKNSFCKIKCLIIIISALRTDDESSTPFIRSSKPILMMGFFYA